MIAALRLILVSKSSMIASTTQYRMKWMKKMKILILEAWIPSKRKNCLDPTFPNLNTNTQMRTIFSKISTQVNIMKSQTAKFHNVGFSSGLI